MNKPYVKEYNSNGMLLNPIKGAYLHESPNRSQRRAKLKKQRFYGESKNCHLTVVKTAKFKRIIQVIKEDTNGVLRNKRIEHYIEC